MDYETLELSTEDGSPVRLYEFTLQSIAFRYTNMQGGIDIGGHRYEGIAITDSGVAKSGDADADALEITLPLTEAFSRKFNGVPPSHEIGIAIHKVHVNADTGELSNSITIWTGIVSGFGRKGLSTRIIRCDSISVSMARSGLRLSWLRNCPHMLYDEQCLVDRDLFAVPCGVPVIVSGTDIRVPEAMAFSVGWFAGGFIEWEISPGVLETRGIETSNGNILTIFGNTYEIDEGSGHRIFPGCARTIQVCSDKYNNHENYGGVPHLAGSSPFDGNPVF